jgi:hypothetical protein
VSEDAIMPPGTLIGAAHFKAGQYLDVTGGELHWCTMVAGQRWELQWGTLVAWQQWSCTWAQWLYWRTVAVLVRNAFYSLDGSHACPPNVLRVNTQLIYHPPTLYSSACIPLRIAFPDTYCFLLHGVPSANNLICRHHQGQGLCFRAQQGKAEPAFLQHFPPDAISSFIPAA